MSGTTDVAEGMAIGRARTLYYLLWTSWILDRRATKGGCMLIATFGPSTGWAGKTITREGETFILQDHGPITARDVMAYDEQSHLVWASEGMRAWVGALVAGPPTADVATQSATSTLAWQPASALPQPQGAPGIGVAGFVCVLVGLFIPLVGIVGLVLSIIGYRQAKREDRPSGLAFAGMIVGIIATAIGLILLAAAIPMFSSQRDEAKDSAVKEGIHSIQIGVQSYAVDHEDAYPDPSLVSRSGLASYVDFWPTNPYTGLPMAQGTAEGDFAYTVSPDGTTFTLRGYGNGGDVVISVP